MKTVLFILVLFSTLFSRADATITEERFNQILLHFEEVAAPWVRENYEMGLMATGDWQKEWNSRSSGGSFYWPEPGVTWGVHIAGWLARHSVINSDALYFTLCHEMGHHVYDGGKERQADYFAARCLRWFWHENYETRVLKAYDRIHIFRVWAWGKHGIKVDAEKINQCRKSVVLLGIQGREFQGCQ